MRVIETTAHVGSDGMLRIEVPMNEETDQDVRVALVVESSPRQIAPPPEGGSVAAQDRWALYRSKLEAAGLTVPAPGRWSVRVSELLRFDGTLVSQSLVEDRR